MHAPVYLDNHATTRVDPRVLDAMLPWFSEEYGNAASRQHVFGMRAEAAVEHARAEVARLIGAAPGEIIFTSGATESINLALKGLAPALRGRGGHVLTSAVEHRAVLDTCRSLEREGLRITVLPVDRFGCVAPESVADAIGPDTILVSIMTANNEIGTLEPVAEIAGICARRGVAFHTDAAQSLGRVPLDVRTIPVTAVSGTAHKMYGPKGAGFLYLRAGAVSPVPQLDGGGHERGIRSGTLNVPGIVGLGRACALAAEEMTAEARRISALRDRLVEGLTAGLPGVSINGHPLLRLPQNASLTFAGISAATLMMDVKDVAVSTGSACTSAHPGLSHVLQAIGLPREAGLGTIRFGLGRFTTAEEIEYVIERLIEAVGCIRSRAPQLEPAASGPAHLQDLHS